MDLAGELQARLTDEMLTKFLVDNIVKDRGATNRLARPSRRWSRIRRNSRTSSRAAAEQAAEIFKDDPQFESVWTSSSEMLMSYSDAKFVSEGYARELTTAQTQAVDVEKIGDDPPVRIRAWLATVSDEEIRALDQQLLLDLLTIETRPDAWSGVLDTAIANIDQLCWSATSRWRAQLLEPWSRCRATRPRRSRRRPTAGVTKLVEGPMVRHLAMFLQQGDRHGVRRRQEDVHHDRPGADQADVGRADGRRQRAHRAAAARHPDLVRRRRRANTPTS